MSLSAVIYEFSVYLVGDDPEVVLFSDVANESHVFQCENSSCRVAWRKTADSFCLRSDCSLDEVSLRPVVAVFCCGCQRYEHAGNLVAECVVVCVERLSDKSFITRVEESCECKDKSLGTAVCDEDVISLILHSEISVHVLDHSVTQFVDSLRLSICNYLLVELSDSFHEAFRSLDIRLANVETIDLFAVFSFGLKSKYIESSDWRELHSCTSF